MRMQITTGMQITVVMQFICDGTTGGEVNYKFLDPADRVPRIV
jgi:hypothetical protein